ncbi:MAG: thymidylate kinase, partial [Thalassospira sp.]
LAIGDFKPDLTVIFDLPLEVGLDRAGARFANVSAAEDRYERMGLAFHERIRDGYREIAATEKDRCVVIDASGDIESVGERVIAAVQGRIAGQGT